MLSLKDNHPASREQVESLFESGLAKHPGMRDFKEMATEANLAGGRVERGEMALIELDSNSPGMGRQGE